MRLLDCLVSAIAKGLFKLRYRIHIKGLDTIDPHLKGALFLPNHPSETDPILIYTYLMNTFHIRPLVVEHFFYMPGVKLFMEYVKAMPIPDFTASGANTWKKKKVDESFQEIATHLNKGENFLIYPSGGLKRTPQEVIGGSSLVHSLLKSVPDVPIVLVRTTGLWGSSFSRASTGKSPPFWPSFVRGIKTVLKNGIFFAPKRDITIEFELAGQDIPRRGTRLELNQYLEAHYNQYPDQEGKRVFAEPINLVSYSRFKEELLEVSAIDTESSFDGEVTVSPEARVALYKELGSLGSKKPDEIEETHNLSQDLGLDSLDVANVRAFLEENYDVEDIEPGDLISVHDVLMAIQGDRVRRTRPVHETLQPFDWPKEPNRRAVEAPKGETILSSFLSVADDMGSCIACVDEIAGPMTYFEMKRAALILSGKFKDYPGKHIGVMLPSSVAAYLTILAVYFAGKIPVELNWTAGSRSLDFALMLLDLPVAVTSRAFLNRLENVELGLVQNKLLLLEDVKASITLGDKIKGAFRAKKKRAHFDRKIKSAPDSTAVVLFTSGTETYPKAVPLTHQNILLNQTAGLKAVNFDKSDILFGALPPFHSFGFSVTGLFPLVTGLRVVYSPDPTDGHRMCNEINRYQASIMCLAPTFYKHLFRAAHHGELDSLKLFVAGAEKASPELYAQVKRRGARMVEGYGITECSPIVTICRPDEEPKGVGRAIDGVELAVIDLDTSKRLKPGGVGEICIRGKSVFSGYLGTSVKNPFIALDNEQWYRSGDIGHIDQDGNLILGGRLKRFVKIGGEMVSLSAIEEELVRAISARKWGLYSDEEVPLALSVKETADKPLLILFSILPLDQKEVNLALREGGFAKIVKIAQVKKLNEIPLTGTGKVHYRKLKEMVDQGG